jgi:hypothetical protein
MKDKRKAYEEKLEAQFEEWNAQTALLKAEADKAKAAYHSAASKFKCDRLPNPSVWRLTLIFVS